MAFCGGGGDGGGRRKYKNSLRSANIADFFFFFLFVLYIRVTRFQGGGDCRLTQRVEMFGVLEGCLLSRMMCLAGGKLRALTPTA